MHGKKKWMSKKFIVILLSGAALFGFPAVASAENQTIFADDDILYYSEDYEEVKQLNDEIEADLEYVLKDEGIDADVELDEEFYKKAVKAYINPGIVGLGTDGESSILERLGECQYQWIFTYKDKYVVEVSKGAEVTDEMRQELSEEILEEATEREGKWYVSAYGGGQYDSDLIEIAENNASDPEGYDRVVVLGGELGFQAPVALAFKDGKAAEFISLGEYAYEAMPDVKSLSFSEAVNNALEITVFPSGFGGNSGAGAAQGVNAGVIALAAAVCAAAAAAGGLYFWRRKKSA